MSITQKAPSDLDFSQTLQGSFNDVDSTLGVNGYLVGKVGRKIVMAISTTSVANDTETYTFSENGTNLYALKIIYTSGTRDVMISAERIS